MIAKLPLESPHWAGLSACYSSTDAVARLREIVSTRRLGEAWDGLRDEILHQGSVYGVTSAALPHLVDLAAELPPAESAELLTEIGFLVTAGADEFPEPPPVPGLQQGLTDALRRAEALALGGFLATSGLEPSETSHYALACVALAGHPSGTALWEFLAPSAGYVRAVCPECEHEHEIDGFVDPVRVPGPPPPVPELTGVERPVAGWAEIATAVEAAGRAGVLGPGWAGHFRVAATVATAGVPADTPTPAIWCLVSAMVATRSAVPWARTLARLAGQFECAECEQVWALGDVVGESLDAEPVAAELVDRATLAGGYGFRPAPPGPTPTSPPLGVRRRWRSSAVDGPVDVLATVSPPERQPLVAAGGSDGVLRLVDLATGEPSGAPLTGPAGPVTALTAIPRPDGGSTLVAAGADGGLCWWDLWSGEPAGTAVTTPATPPTEVGPPIRSMAPLPMPAEPGRCQVPWLARLRDGRTLLATGDADGAVRLWDPVTRTPQGTVFERAGRPVLAMAALDADDRSPEDGGALIVLYPQRTVDVWTPAAVTGARSTMGPDEARLAAAGHDRLVAVTASPTVTGRPDPDTGRRRRILLVDANGPASVWETYGVRLSDPPPPDAPHGEVVGVAVLTGVGGPVIATVGRTGRGLRLWQPATGAVASVPLDVPPRCLLGIGSTLVVGDDAGLSAFTLASGEHGMPADAGRQGQSGPEPAGGRAP